MVRNSKTLKDIKKARDIEIAKKKTKLVSKTEDNKNDNLI